MKAHLTEPTERGYYWWLPEFLKGNPNNPQNWEIQFCSPETNIGRVGVFYGPIPAPIDLEVEQ